MSKGIPVGLRGLCYATLTTETAKVGTTDGTATYGATAYIAGAISANFSPNASNDTIFADDGPFDTASTLGAMTLELNVADIPTTDRATLLGASVDSTHKVLVHKATDTPPWVATGVIVKKSNGADRYIWYLKGKYAMPDDNNQTKADSINWNTPTITGNFVKRDCDDAFKYVMDTDDDTVPAKVISDFFKNPNVLSVALT